MTEASPYEPLLRTNYVPPGDDTQKIREVVSNTREELGRVEAEIRELQTRQLGILGHVKVHQALLAPIRQVPNEILQEIFLHVVTKDWVTLADGVSQPPAWTLSWVCSRWRAISLATPQIWSFIAVLLTDGGDHELRLCRAHLDRSNQSPLSFKLYVTNDIENEYTAVEEELYTLFTPHFSRVKDLVLSGWDGEDVSHTFPRHFGGFKSLNTLELNHIPVDDQFMPSRSLRSVVVEYPSWEDCAELKLPWSSLTSLDVRVSHGAVSAFAKVLVQATALKELHVYASINDSWWVQWSEGSDRQEPGVIRLGNLCRLALTMNEIALNAWGSIIPGRLVLPRLRSIILDDLREVGMLNNFATHLHTVIQSSQGNVNSLSLIIGIRNRIEDLTRLLLSMPNIQYFSLTITVLSSDFHINDQLTLHSVAERLNLSHTSSDDTNNILPRLRALTLVSPDKLEDAGTSLVNVLKSRTSPCINILRLGVVRDYKTLFTEEEQKYVDHCVAQGMMLEVTENRKAKFVELSPSW